MTKFGQATCSKCGAPVDLGNIVCERCKARPPKRNFASDLLVAIVVGVTLSVLVILLHG